LVRRVSFTGTHKVRARHDAIAKRLDVNRPSRVCRLLDEAGLPGLFL
jgi:hypothetical protein